MDLKKLLQTNRCLILSCWHYCPLVCVSLQSSLCVFPSSSSWGCCHKSTRSSCTSLSSWTSMCSGAMVSDLYMHNFSAGVTLTSTEWDNRHTYIYYVKAGFVKVLICIQSGPVPVRLSGLIADTLSVLSAASTSLLSALYSILRSIVTVALLYGFCYGALKVRPKPTKGQYN